jgi:hypothetical protein
MVAISTYPELARLKADTVLKATTAKEKGTAMTCLGGDALNSSLADQFECPLYDDIEGLIKGIGKLTELEKIAASVNAAERPNP